MAKGLSLHIGLNCVDPNHYKKRNGKPWHGTLHGAESDAHAMHEIASIQGFRATKLLREDAKIESVVQNIEHAAKELSAGDTFFISYAGHGGQVVDTSGDEGDGYDETWCLYDGQILDDELLLLWSRFDKGVRVLIVSDSCHSGTISRGAAAQHTTLCESARDEAMISGASALEAKGEEIIYRFMPPIVSIFTSQRNREFYDEVKRKLPKNIPNIDASVKLLAGCRDHQFSQDGKDNGFFTSTLLKVWDDGKFNGTYEEFHREIHDDMTHWFKVFQRGAKQEPNYDTFGMDDPQFSRPFTI